MIDHERWWTSELVHVFVGKGKKTLGEFPIHFVLNTVLKWQMLRWCWDAKYPLSWQDRFRFQWHWGINNGVWILKNTAWSHRFLETWWRSDILQGPGKARKWVFCHENEGEIVSDFRLSSRFAQYEFEGQGWFSNAQTYWVTGTQLQWPVHHASCPALRSGNAIWQDLGFLRGTCSIGSFGEMLSLVTQGSEWNCVARHGARGTHSWACFSSC